MADANEIRCVTFRCFGNTNDFLPPRWQNADILHQFQGTPSVKDRVETLGIPHTEVGYLNIDGRFSGFGQKLTGGERVGIYPPRWTFEETANKPAPAVTPPDTHSFVADVHLGRLARLLRLLGFDTLYRNDYDDNHLADISADGHRILLTRDRRLLMRRIVKHGYFLRSDKPAIQIVEVLKRYGLHAHALPFKRCSRCNGLVHSTTKESVLPLLEARTKIYYEDFWQCENCQQVYWEGSHMAGLNQLIEDMASTGTAPA